MDSFIADYQKSLLDKISLNPVLNCFQQVVHQYNLQDLVIDFLKSMKADLHKNQYENGQDYNFYIHGSANVVGLMCLKVFVNNDPQEYENLKPYAMKLGSAFQKVNFLRDFHNDTHILQRSYFPNVQMNELNETNKKEIVADIDKDFEQGFIGIKKLPKNCKLGVFLAYKYYRALLKKLRQKSPEKIMMQRTRIPNFFKLYIFLKVYIRYKINCL